MQVWEHLTVMAQARPIAGNMGGSALTMFSSSGLVFGILQVGLWYTIPIIQQLVDSLQVPLYSRACMQWHTT